MNEAPQSPKGLRRNQRKIMEFMMEGPSQLQSYARLKGAFCDWHVMSDNRLRSSLKSLVKWGFLGVIVLDNEGRFYGLPNIVNDLSIQSASRKRNSARGNRIVAERVRRFKAMTAEEMIDMLMNLKEKPVFRPNGVTAKQRRTQMKNYLLMIDWQIDWYKQKIAKKP